MGSILSMNKSVRAFALKSIDFCTQSRPASEREAGVTVGTRSWVCAMDNPFLNSY